MKPAEIHQREDKAQFASGTRPAPSSWQSAPGWTTANFGLILIQGLLPLVSLYLMKLIVDAVTAGLMAADKIEPLKRG